MTASTGVTPTRVVLIGGGYASLFAYRGLLPAIRSGAARVTVLSADTHHNFHGFTGDVVAGMIPYRLTRAPLAELMPHAEVVVGAAVRVDRAAGTVTVGPSGGGPDRTVEYDELVIAAGGREPLDAIPGMSEHGYTLRAPGEFNRFLERLGDLPAAGGADPVVIVGGGMAGVELAAAVVDRLRGGRTRSERPVVLVHSGDEVLPGPASRMVRVARRELARAGVSTRPNVRVLRLDEAGAHLSDGGVIAAAAVLSTNGQRPVAVPGLDDLDHDPQGRLVTDRQLRVGGNVWAAGDVARVSHPGSGVPVTANALWAIKAGSHLGRNLNRVIRGRRPRPFRYRGLGQAMAFGVGRSAAELYGVPLSGWVGWLLRMSFFLRFMPQRRQAFGVLAALVMLPVRGRFPLPTAPQPRVDHGVPHGSDRRVADSVGVS